MSEAESVFETEIKDSTKTIMLLTLGLLKAVAKLFDCSRGNFFSSVPEAFCSHAVYCN